MIVRSSLVAAVLLATEAHAVDDARARVESLGGVVREVSRSDGSLRVDFHLHGTALTDADLAVFGEMDAVVDLNLGRTAITDAGLGHLAGLQGLRSLNLSNTAIDGSGLSALVPLSELQVLNLYGTEVGDAALASLAAMPSLQRVYLWGSKVSWEAAAELVDLHPDLRLDLGATAKPFPAQFVPTPESRAAAAARLAELGAAVRRIAQDSDAVEVDFHLTGKEVSDDDLRHLRSVDHLHELNLAGCSITDAGVRHLASLRDLRRLHLQNTALSDRGLAFLGRLAQLEYLNVYGTQVSDAGLEVVGAMGGLKKVYLWKTGVSWEGAELLRGRRPELLVDRGWDADGPPRWSPPTEEEIEAARAAIAEIGGVIRRLDQVSEDVEIDFHLGGKELTDDGLEHVARIPDVVELNLAGTKVSSAGMAKIAAMPRLERLHLENTAVDDAATEQLRYLTTLRYLNLYGTKVGDAGVARLKTLRRLERLYLWQSQATPAVGPVLTRHIPELRVEFGWDLSPPAESAEPTEGGRP